MLLSGPPKFRLRDPNASLYGEIDWVILFQVSTWGIAGIWVFYQLWFSNRSREFKFLPTEKLSLLLVGLLLVSAISSEGQALTLFKVYQLLISILFASVFVRKWGAEAAFNGIFVGCAILCAADVIAAFVAPDMVFGFSEVGVPRFRGDLLGPTEAVSLLPLILLLALKPMRSKVGTILGVALLGSVLVLSLARTAYLAFLIFLLLALWKAPDHLKLLRGAVRWGLVALPLVVLGGALAQLEEYRPSESLWTLSDRVGLWAYLIDVMWSTSPWFGLGYFSASRVYGPQFNEGLGTAHSVFVEVLAGGGITSFVVFVALWCVLIGYAVRLFRRATDATSFVAVALLPVTFTLVFVGSELEAHPAGFTFWILVTAIPLLCGQSREMAYELNSSFPVPPEGRLQRSP